MLDPWVVHGYKSLSCNSFLGSISFARRSFPRRLKIQRSISIRSQNPVAQYPFDLKIPSLKIHSISQSRRSKSIRSQNPVAQNPLDLKIQSKKIVFSFAILDIFFRLRFFYESVRFGLFSLTLFPNDGCFLLWIKYRV